MRFRSTTPGLHLLLSGLALLAWLAYDASHIRETLGLGTVASEGSIALVALVVSLALIGAGAFAWWRGRREPVVESFDEVDLASGERVH